MNKVAEFHKVSYEQFKKDWIDTFDEPNDAELREELYIMATYDTLQKPIRSTVGSAGHDFFSPLDFTLEPGEDIKVPTGIRCKMNDDYVLLVFPRSSLGFKYQLMMSNTIPVIDQSYYYADNEGHIFIKVVNMGKKPVSVKKGDRFCQGILFSYGVAFDADPVGKRTGGLGSTGK